ncbi:peptidase S41 [Aliidiomarina sedimenti]|uniref:Peptidase S41 n=1 Tax=Aliidiomarina sedimenti TaxID=1933879 RepID=A0ABY0C2M4_9GAMM|nr:S41 family peptidase [Aliidiomarina sedimenti]RUO32115.1 peptidase S41 [Aliidiomarina sedimenti]
MKKLSVIAATVMALTACGSDSSPAPTPTSNPTADQCSVEGQNQQLIDNLRRDYLWNDQLPDSISASSYSSPYALLEDVVPPLDRFSFMITRQEYEDRYVNATFFGLGFGYAVDPEREELRINYVYENSPAGRAGITRGALLTRINDIDMSTFFSSDLYARIERGEASWNEVFGPNQEGAEVSIEWRRPDGTLDDDVLAREEVETNTIMAVERYQLDNGDHAGYFVFDSFIDRSAQDINTAIDQLVAAGGVDELIIDLRYNGGGLIRIANQIASQASWDFVENETFLTFNYNDNYADEEYLFDLGDGIERLNLPRVVVLTTGASCSSSEIIINSLEPFVDVVTVGQPTCGKPVGQSPTQICDKMLFAINFQTVNAEGEGDYFDGLTPTCSAQDRAITDWGDLEDPLLAEAYHYLQTGSCSASATGIQDKDANIAADNWGAAQSDSAQSESQTPQSITDRSRNPLLEKWRQQQ